MVSTVTGTPLLTMTWEGGSQQVFHIGPSHSLGAKPTHPMNTMNLLSYYFPSKRFSWKSDQGHEREEWTSWPGEWPTFRFSNTSLPFRSAAEHSCHSSLVWHPRPSLRPTCLFTFTCHYTSCLESWAHVTLCFLLKTNLGLCPCLCFHHYSLLPFLHFKNSLYIHSFTFIHDYNPYLKNDQV